MSALPQKLVPMPKQRQVSGIKSQTVEISPVNGSSATVYDPNTQNRLIFQIPSYPNGFLDCSKTFIKVRVASLSAGSAFEDGLPIFERVMVKSGSGAVLEDIQDVDVLESLLELNKERSLGSARTALTGDNIVALANRNTRQSGNFVCRPVPGGVLGEGQEYYLPLHLMGGPYALELELWLNPATRCVRTAASATTAAYTLDNVSLQLEIVNMPEDVCKKLDTAICGGESLTVPFSTFRTYRNIIGSGATTASIQIHEVSPNVEGVMMAFLPSAAPASDIERFLFEGGSESGSEVLKEYQFRYADRYMPLQPVKNLHLGSTPALMNVLKNSPVPNPKFCELDGTHFPLYMTKKFFIKEDFQTDPSLISGLSTQAHAGPIESFLTFNAGLSADILARTYAKSSHNISVGRDGITGLGMVA